MPLAASNARLPLVIILGLAFAITGCSLLPTSDPRPTTTTTASAPRLTTTTTSSAAATTTTTPPLPTSTTTRLRDPITSQQPPSPVTQSLVDAICANDFTTTTSDALPNSLNELSGLAASRSHSGLLWAIEDSGNPPNVSAIDISGELRATISLASATNTDWEAIALRPGSNGDELIIADVGDNALSRANVTLYFLNEPPPQNATITPTRITATYSDGPHNVEALVATANMIQVITKVNGRAAVYELDGTIFRPRGLLPDNPGLVTDASVSLGGSLTALRTYGSVRVAEVTTSNVTEAITSLGCSFTFAEPQGESVTILPNDEGLVTVSEIAPAMLHIIRRNE